MSKCAKSCFNYFIRLYILFLFSLFTFNFVSSADSYRLNVGDPEVLIDEHGVSRYAGVTDGSDVFVPTKTALEWQRFREHLAPHIFLKYYGSWSCIGSYRCARTRSVTQWTYDDGQVTSLTITETEYARTSSSSYGRFTGSTCSSKVTGTSARWTSCKRCGFLWISWCCDWEQCNVNNAGANGDCTTSFGSGSCCRAIQNCDSCRSMCVTSPIVCSNNGKC